MLKNILIVEDEILVARNIERKLKNTSVDQVKIVLKGQKAIDEINSNMPDLVLLDISLQDDIDGLEVGRQLRLKTADVPIIFMSAHNDLKTVERIKDLEKVDLVVKPFSCQDLFEKIGLFYSDFKILESTKSFQ